MSLRLESIHARNHSYILLGPDQPNQFTRLMQVLSVHSLQILDVGQAVIHNQLTLGIVVASDNETATALAMKF